LPWDIVGKIIVSGYLFKVGMAALDSPVIYVAVALLRRYIGADSVEEGVEGRSTLKL